MCRKQPTRFVSCPEWEDVREIEHLYLCKVKSVRLLLKGHVTINITFWWHHKQNGTCVTFSTFCLRLDVTAEPWLMRAWPKRKPTTRSLNKSQDKILVSLSRLCHWLQETILGAVYSITTLNIQNMDNVAARKFNVFVVACFPQLVTSGSDNERGDGTRALCLWAPPVLTRVDEIDRSFGARVGSAATWAAWANSHVKEARDFLWVFKCYSHAKLQQVGCKLCIRQKILLCLHGNFAFDPSIFPTLK